MSWPSKWKKALILKIVHSKINRIVLWSSVQRDFVINKLRIPSSKIALVCRRADTKFWRPMEGSNDIICSAGQEMRDYDTLLKALEGTDVKCHIATGRLLNTFHKSSAKLLSMKKTLQNISVRTLKTRELRELYARSRFVVIPLMESDTDNGVTTIEESMAMGKAVICSRTMGQVDMIQENETGMYVPVGDHLALRKAILHLWNNPDIAEKMGKKGRIFIEENHTIELFVQQVKKIIDEAMIASSK